MPPRTPLLQPETYFRNNGFSLGPALKAVGAAIVALAIALLGFGILLANHLRAGGHNEAASTVTSVFIQELIGLVVMLFIGWFIVTLILHGLCRLFINHDGSFGETLIITGWGMAPSVLTSIVGFALLAIALGNTTVASPEAFVQQFQQNLDNTAFIRGAVGFGVAAWQTYLYGYGITVEFNTSGSTPFQLAGLVAFTGWLFTLA